MAYENLQSNRILKRTKNKKLTMKKVSDKNILHIGAVHIHVDPHPILLIKINNYLKVKKYCVKNNFGGDPMLEKSDMYEF